VPIKWNGVKGYPNLIIFGEMGNGKSTTGNVLQKLLLQDNGKKFSKSNAFEAGKAS